MRLPAALSTFLDRQARAAGARAPRMQAVAGCLRRFFDLPMLMNTRPEWLQADDLPPDFPSDDDNDEEDKENRMEWSN
jgi:hypothetical protein